MSSPFISAFDAVYDPFGSLALTVTDPVQTLIEPLSLEDVKSYLRMAPGDTSEDPLLLTFITAAREQAEILQNRDLVRKQWDLHYDYWPEYRVHLRAPTVSVDLVSYKDISGLVTTMTAATNFVVDLSKQPAVLTPTWNVSWPTFTPNTSGAVLIRFTSGYSPDSVFWSDAGARIKVGMLMLITSWHEQRLPFDSRSGNEYPYAVTSCLSYGALERVR